MQLEEQAQKEWAKNFARTFDYKIDGKVDMILVSKVSKADFAWIETKNKPTDCWRMLTQIVLTAEKHTRKGNQLPILLGACDTQSSHFVPIVEYLKLFKEAHDFDWTDTANNPKQKTIDTVKKYFEGKTIRFDAGDTKEIKEFFDEITHSPEGKIEITAHTFVQVFNHWMNEVYPYITLTPTFERNNVKPADFFLADLMLDGSRTLFKKLRLYLEHEYYKFVKNPKEFDVVAQCTWKDSGAAYKAFWNKYKRPPREEYQNEILTRRDLLIPATFRVKTGAYFTPQPWADKALDYLTTVLGKKWQDVYTVWDCAAGTGNLLNGLSSVRNVFASTLEHEDVQTIKEMDKLFENNIFQFDFLNDDFVPVSQGGKVPDALYQTAAEKPKKILFFINPPYIQPGARSSEHKSKIGVLETKVNKKLSVIGKIGDLQNQFLYRIKWDFPKSKLGVFCVPKFITGSSLNSFRKIFTANFKTGFVVPAYTFDNDKGHFPITFTIWDLGGKSTIEDILCPVDVFGDLNQPRGTKIFYASEFPRITKWVKDAPSNKYGVILLDPDFSQQTYFSLSDKAYGHHLKRKIDDSNLVQIAVAFSTILAVPDNWLIHQDQFFTPHCPGWNTDIEFQSDCLILTAFHRKNNAHNWIPFAETDVKAPVRFQSDNFVKFIKKRLKETGALSPEAQAVFESAKTMWKYAYMVGNLREENPRHCDISLPFLEPNKKRAKIIDPEFAKLSEDFTAKWNVLNDKIIPKIYEHGFLSILPPTGIPDIGNGFFGE